MRVRAARVGIARDRARNARVHRNVMGSQGCRRFCQQPTGQASMRASAYSTYRTRHIYVGSVRRACACMNETCARDAMRARGRCDEGWEGVAAVH